MGYTITNLNMDQAKTTCSTFDYALLYQYSAIELKKAGKVTEADLEECTEARFFQADSELHLIFGDDPMAVLVKDDSNNSRDITRTYELTGKYQAAGRNLIVREYVDEDCDGQSVIALTRLAGINRG